MNLQDERIQAACRALALGAIAEHYPALAQEAADGDASFVDFLEHCLKAEQHERRIRSQTMLTKFAGFPAIKLIDDYDFKFAAGAPKKTVQTLQSVKRTSSSSAPAASAKLIWPSRSAISPRSQASRCALSPPLIWSCSSRRRNSGASLIITCGAPYSARAS